MEDLRQGGRNDRDLEDLLLGSTSTTSQLARAVRPVKVRGTRYVGSRRGAARTRGNGRRAMVLGYRTILSTDATLANTQGILEVLQEWVTKKKRFSSLPLRGETVKSSSGSTLKAAQYGDEHSGAYRWVLTEDWGTPEWTGVVESSRIGITTITLISGQGRVWLWVDIEPPTLTLQDYAGREREEPQYTGTPAFVRDILDNVAMQDGITEPMSELMTIATDSHVDEVVRVLEDPTRIGAVYVTSPPENVSVKGWAESANTFLGAIQGLGFGYALTAATLATFNQRARFGHSISPGSMRTFLPGADLNDPSDSVHHRLLHASTIRDSDDRRIRRIVRSAQIRRLNEIRLPAILRDADYEFLRQERSRPFEVLRRAEPVGVLPGATTESRIAELEATIAELRSSLEDAETMALAGADELMVKERKIVDLDEELGTSQLEGDDLYTQLVRHRDDANRFHAQVVELQNRMAALGAEGVAAAYEIVDTPAAPVYPESFKELYKRIGELSGVRFFGDKDDLLELDEHSVLGEAALMKSWDALLTFNAYVRLRNDGEFDQSLSNFLTFRDHGHEVRLSARVVWAEGEQASTGKKGAERDVHRIPESISKTGTLRLTNHVRIATIGTVAPRLYFEDTYSKAGFVLLGHFGAHLTNTMTN